jgi:hypothetical protein
MNAMDTLLDGLAGPSAVESMWNPTHTLVLETI